MDEKERKLHCIRATQWQHVKQMGEGGCYTTYQILLLADLARNTNAIRLRSS